MTEIKNDPKIFSQPISNVRIGQYLANLGEVLEIEEQESHFCLIIGRLNEKQVIRFGKEELMILIHPD